jgi:SAM-dependent methyltransferase
MSASTTPSDPSFPDPLSTATGLPSPWVAAHAHLLTVPGQVLDLAAGSGRHTRYFNKLGWTVLAVDRDISGLAALRGAAGVEVREIDLETGAPWPFEDRRFAAIVVTNYLHRPLLHHLAAALVPGGLLFYETFAEGNERFGRPRNPDFLLKRGELLTLAGNTGLTVLAYEHGEIAGPRPAVIQHIVARKPDS